MYDNFVFYSQPERYYILAKGKVFCVSYPVRAEGCLYNYTDQCLSKCMQLALQTCKAKSSVNKTNKNVQALHALVHKNEGQPQERRTIYTQGRVVDEHKRNVHQQHVSSISNILLLDA